MSRTFPMDWRPVKVTVSPARAFSSSCFRLISASRRLRDDAQPRRVFAADPCPNRAVRPLDGQLYLRGAGVRTLALGKQHLTAGLLRRDVQRLLGVVEGR